MSPSPSPTARSGQVRWSAAIPAQALAVAGDASGNVFVQMDLPPSRPGASDTQIWKLDSRGRKLWSVALPDGLWAARLLEVLASGDLAVAACAVPFCYSQDATPFATALLRVSSADGHVVWRTAMPGSGYSSLSAGPGGTVLAVSTPVGFAVNGLGARLVHVSADGAILLDQPSDVVRARAAMGGSSGGFIVAGENTAGAPWYERRRPDGSPVWFQALETAGGHIHSVDFAPNGSVAIAGWFRDRLVVGGRTHEANVTSGFLVVASGDGRPQWSTSDAELSGSTMPPVLAFGRDNDVVTYTMTFGKGQANLRSYTRDGALNWRHDFAGIYGTWVNAVAVARNGDIVVGGNGAADVPFQALPYPKSTQFVAVIAP